MTSILIYPALAVLVLALAILLARRNRPAPLVLEGQGKFGQELWEDAGLRLAERVFDSSDYFWLRDEVGFPELACVLKQTRQSIALDWLLALRRSFHQLVLIPETASPGGGRESGLRSWMMLWHTLRFQFVLAYAIFVVRHFGPYHRMIPFFPRARATPEDDYALPDFGTSGSGRIY
ncbi:MAG TPA: hypothetical protein VFD30_19915 [Terriglobia bacterium]|nr:hypothetical protein [Terriglobia bacterium]